MQELRLTALLLRIIPYSESSVVLHAFSRERGQMSLMARGVRRKGSKLAPLLQSGHLLELQVLEKEGRDLQLLKDADLLDAFAGARERYDALLCRSAVLELLERSQLPEQAEPDLFDQAHWVLDRSSRADCSWPLNLIYWFLLYLLVHSGYGLSLGACSGCARELQEFWKEPGSELERAQGLLHCPACARNAHGDQLAPQLLRALYFLSRAEPEKIQSREITLKTRVQLGHLLGGLFREHVNGNAELLSLKEAEGV